MNNFFSLPASVAADGPEFLETVLRGSGAFRVERILSHGQTTPDGEWYDQEEDEWVLVLEGSALLGYPDGSELRLEKGDQCFLPKHVKHRVAYTSSPCVWLAVFADSLAQSTDRA